MSDWKGIMKGDFKRFCLSLTGGLLGVILGFIVGCMLMYFYVARHSVYAQKPDVENVDTVLLNTQNSAQTKDGIEKKAKVGIDFYLCEITDFYESLITILFSTIGITLVIGFFYVYNASRKRADDMARNALDEDSFKIKLKEQIKDAVAKIRSDNNLPEMVEELEYTLNQISAKKIIDRIDFLEKNITKSSYPVANNVITEEPQEESSDGNN